MIFGNMELNMVLEKVKVNLMINIFLPKFVSKQIWATIGIGKKVMQGETPACSHWITGVVVHGYLLKNYCLCEVRFLARAYRSFFESDRRNLV